MNFQQLRIIRETVRRNFNLTEVANALYTSQSGVSKHIKDLEDELGVELFVRRGKRLLGMTEPGKELVGIVERMLLDAKNIKRLAEHFAQERSRRADHRDDAHPGAICAAAGRREVQESVSQGAAHPASGQPEGNRRPCCWKAALISASPPRRWRKTRTSSLPVLFLGARASSFRRGMTLEKASR